MPPRRKPSGNWSTVPMATPRSKGLDKDMPEHKLPPAPGQTSRPGDPPQPVEHHEGSGLGELLSPEEGRKRLAQYDAESKLQYCANCGEPHTEAAIAFAKAIGASSALCRKCTAIEKAKRGISNAD